MSQLLSANAWEIPITQLDELVRYLQRVKSQRTPLNNGALIHQLAQRSDLFYHCEFELTGRKRWTCTLRLDESVQQATSSTKQQAKELASRVLLERFTDDKKQMTMDSELPTARGLDEPDYDDQRDHEEGDCDLYWSLLTASEKQHQLDDEIDRYQSHHPVQEDGILTRLCTAEHETRALLRIENVPEEMIDEDLRSLCETIGSLKALIRSTDPTIAHVQYRFVEHTSLALVELNKLRPGDRYLRVDTVVGDEDDDWMIA